MPCKLAYLSKSTSYAQGFILPYSSSSKAPVMLFVGIGAAAAKKFASKGYAVALLSRNMDKLKPVESEITIAGGRAVSLPTDAGLQSSILDRHYIMSVVSAV